MQKVKLPLTVDAVRSAQKNLDYDGYYPAKLAARVLEVVESVDSDIDARFSFKRDEQGLTVIQGDAQVTVTLSCQRCGGVFSHVVTTAFCFSPVNSDQKAKAVPERYEAIQNNEFGEVDLLAALEDEIILSLPLAPVHDFEHCEVSEAERSFGDLPVEEEKTNPFSVLASLKSK